MFIRMCYRGPDGHCLGLFVFTTIIFTIKTVLGRWLKHSHLLRNDCHAVQQLMCVNKANFLILLQTKIRRQQSPQVALLIEPWGGMYGKQLSLQFFSERGREREREREKKECGEVVSETIFG
jgi:hypothetical protein